MPHDVDNDGSSVVYMQHEAISGFGLIGREVLICWDDGVWYDAVVVQYYPLAEEYKVVYRFDDAIEIAKLRDRRWILAPKKRANNKNVILDGAIVEFKYPSDGKRYRAIIYDHSHGGERLKVAYIEEHTTDNLKGGGWDFITNSPCDDAAPAEILHTNHFGKNLVQFTDDEDDTDNDAKNEQTPVENSAAVPEPTATKRETSGITKKRKASKGTKSLRRGNRSGPAGRSSTRSGSRTRRWASS